MGLLPSNVETVHGEYKTVQKQVFWIDHGSCVVRCFAWFIQFSTLLCIGNAAGYFLHAKYAPPIEVPRVQIEHRSCISHSFYKQNSWLSSHSRLHWLHLRVQLQMHPLPSSSLVMQYSSGYFWHHLLHCVLLHEHLCLVPNGAPKINNPFLPLARWQLVWEVCSIPNE